MKRYIFFCLLTLLLWGSCQEDFVLPEASSALVVEGWIEQGSFPVVQLTRTLPVSTKPQDISTLNDYAIKWAKVTVSDGENQVILIGMHNEEYFPPFIFTTTDLRGEANKKYTLTVEYQNSIFTAETTIPAVAPDCQYQVVKSPENDTLCQIKALLSVDCMAGGYCQFFTKTDATTRQFQPCLGGSLSPEMDQTQREVMVHRGQRWDEYPYSPYYTQSDVVTVKFARLDEVSYRIWESYTRNLSLSRLMFLSPSSDIETNIHGGYGYWCGLNSIKTQISIGDSIVSNGK